jgi:hypothetical protein
VDILYYVLSLLVASAAMISAAWTGSSDTRSSAANAAGSTPAPVSILFATMIVMELVLLGYESAQLWVLSSEWGTVKNCIGLLSMLLLVTASVDFFADYQLQESWPTMANAGSIGLCLKWIGLLEFLGSFTCAHIIEPCQMLLPLCVITQFYKPLT